MAHNSLSPSYVKLFYATDAGALVVQHVATVPCIAVPTGGGGYEFEIKSGGANVAADVAIDALVAVLRPCVNSAVTFQYAELWLQATATSDPVFAELYDLGVAGTNAAAGVYLVTQAVITGRTTAGGQFRQYLISAATLPNEIFYPPAYDGGGFGTWANYVVGDDTWICGRDNGFADSVKRVLTKTNDALRRKFAS